MKKILIIVMLMLISITSMGQEFTHPSKSKAAVDSTTTFTYKMTDNTYKVYKSKNGAFYIWKVSGKTGKPYRMYLPKEIQTQMGRKYS